jgi:hypothetical protein
LRMTPHPDEVLPEPTQLPAGSVVVRAKTALTGTANVATPAASVCTSGSFEIKLLPSSFHTARWQRQPTPHQ